MHARVHRLRGLSRTLLVLGIALLAAGQAAAQTVEQRLSELEGRLACIAPTSNASNLRLVGCNLHVLDGSGTTGATPNGLGNIIIGYNEGASAQTGSHNLVVGQANSFSSYGGIVAGFQNSITAKFSSVTGGLSNLASGDFSSVAGGNSGTAGGWNASVHGGWQNQASGSSTAVLGGVANHAAGANSTVSGGQQNLAFGESAAVSGGQENEAYGASASVLGGFDNGASGVHSTVGGGHRNTASGERASVMGGVYNTASGTFTTVSGGHSSTASGEAASVSGGINNVASGLRSSVSGGGGNIASGALAAVSGGTFNQASNSGASVSGGKDNHASSSHAWIGGGHQNRAQGVYSATVGGAENNASGYRAVVGGGIQITASGDSEAASGGLAQLETDLTDHEARLEDHTDALCELEDFEFCPPPSKTVFLTSTPYNGNLGGIAGADSKCAERALAAGLGGTYKAWISTSASDDPESRFTRSDGPYVRTDGAVIANNWADLTDGTIAQVIHLDEFGDNVGVANAFAWTGTFESGASALVNCQTWTNSEDSIGEYGWPGATGGAGWSLIGNQNCSSERRLLCFEQ